MILEFDAFIFIFVNIPLYKGNDQFMENEKIGNDRSFIEKSDVGLKNVSNWPDRLVAAVQRRISFFDQE